MTKRGISLELLKQRYPDLGFLLSFFPHEQVDLPTNPSPLVEWLKGVDLETTEVLYIIGLIGYPLPDSLERWLCEKKERALIFVEEDLGAFAALADHDLLIHPQVHLHYASEDPTEVLAQRFPTVYLAIFEGKLFDAEQLTRRSCAYSALYSDVLYSHKIVENVIHNMQRLTDAFDARADFTNVPAVICGAGPSLGMVLSELEKIRNKALVIAGGTAVAAMTKKGVKPHLAMALDPNNEEFDRLKQASYFEGPFLFAPRLHRHAFATANGPFGYMKTDTGGLVESWLEAELALGDEPIGPDLGDEAFSVTTLAISYAYALGCNPIILVGVDLAYTGGERYTEGIEAQPESLKRISRKDIHGKEIETHLKWVMESECISRFAKSHPERKFLNASGGGIGFAGIENKALTEALEGHRQRDLEGELHQWIQMHPLKWSKERLPELFSDLKGSLIRSEELVEKILEELQKKKESGRLTLFESDLTEELCYQSLLEGVALALDHILIRYYPNLDEVEGKWERKEARYRELQRQIRKFQEVTDFRK